ncbi:MAG: hypothetical protein ACOC32_03260 [Nanoarchaeota archaeon]
MNTIVIQGDAEPFRKDMAEIAREEGEKIASKIGNDIEILLHVKKSKQTRYELSLRITHPGSIITAKNVGWNPLAVLKESFDDVTSQIEHKNKFNIREKASADVFFPTAAES